MWYLTQQVGDPNMDHHCWERPEDMDTPRNVYKVSTQNPGSDVAAETAAALAAASVVFKDSDPSYSTKLLKTAMKVNIHDKLHRFSLPNILLLPFTKKMDCVGCRYLILQTNIEVLTVTLSTQWSAHFTAHIQDTL